FNEADIQHQSSIIEFPASDYSALHRALAVTATFTGLAPATNGTSSLSLPLGGFGTCRNDTIVVKKDASLQGSCASSSVSCSLSSDYYETNPVFVRYSALQNLTTELWRQYTSVLPGCAPSLAVTYTFIDVPELAMSTNDLTFRTI